MDAAAHSHHPADSAGSRCVSCHMPMTEFARMRRSDHSMRPPAPSLTLAFDSPNACNLCHADETAAVGGRAGADVARARLPGADPARRRARRRRAHAATGRAWTTMLAVVRDPLQDEVVRDDA